MVIPTSWNDPRVYWEKLTNPVTVVTRGVTVLVEPCRPGFLHAVTVDDVAHVMGLLPPDDIARIKAVVLRVPTRKQHGLAGVWGRMAYFAQLGAVEGPVVMLEANPAEYTFTKSSSLSPDEAEEVDRLRSDGHEVTSSRRGWRIRTTLDSVRRTQLFRTLPHEVGHHVQFDRAVRVGAGGDWEAELRLRDLYFTKPRREKEDFAHRYAREFIERVSALGQVPFPRIVDEVRMRQAGLEPAWFGLEN